MKFDSTRRSGLVAVRMVLVSGLSIAAVSLTALGMLGHGDDPTDALPPVPFPPPNPLTEPKRVLGKILFWDEQLSSDNTVSCATCHSPQSGGGDSRRVPHPGVNGVFGDPDDVFASPGVIRQDAGDNYQRDPAFQLNPQITNRTAQTVINAAYTPLAFWDGRASSQFVDPQTGQIAIPQGGALESQIVGPPINDIEMAHTARDWTQIIEKLTTAAPLALATDVPPDMQGAIQSHPTYPQLFAAAFGDAVINARRIAFAIATYERTLVADQTDWDAFQAGNPNAMTPQEQLGFQQFQARNCAVCHTPPLFTNANGATPVPATFRNIGLRPPGDDPGRFLITGIPGDDRRFKVPTLRNAALKSSFSHTGQFTTLQQMVGFYANVGLQFPQNRDPLLPIPMPPPEVNNIAAFIAGALVDPRVAAGQFPFDHPTLFTKRPNVNLVPTGLGLAGTGGQPPQWIANIPPNVGNSEFKVGVRQALSGASATLRIAKQPPVNNIVSPEQVVGPITLDSSGTNTQGYGTAHWPIAADASLNGQIVYMQWFVTDPAAPGGQARSQPLKVTLFCGPNGCPEAPCYPDCDGSGSLAIDDFICFQTRFALGDLFADCDESGSLGIDDFVCFQTLFAVGC